jgi:DNA-binding transcriptional LysR family regulator
MSTAPSWDHCRTLLAVMEAGSLSGAARSLGLSQPTAGRHIEQLEADFGLPLFTRSPTGLRPTDFALSLRRHVETMAAAADAAVRDAAGETQTVSGVVRITAPDMLGVEVLPPILTEISARHPRLVIELDLSNRNEDLLRRQADIAVRTVRPAQGALLARRVGAVPVWLYAHRRYLEARGVPESLNQPGHRAIGFDKDMQTQRLMETMDLPLTRDDFGFRADNQLAQLAAIRAGLGIGACQAGIARRDPDLIPVLTGQFRFQLEIWVAMHEDLRSSLRMGLVFDRLVAGLLDYVSFSVSA